MNLPTKSGPELLLGSRKQVGLRLPISLLEAIDQQAQDLQLSRTDAIQLALVNWLQDKN